MSGATILVIAVLGIFGLFCLLFVLRMAWAWRFLWLDGYYRIILYNEDKHIVSVMKRMVGVRSFSLDVEGVTHRFEIESDKIFTQGRFKIRTLHYVLGDLKPKGNWIPVMPPSGIPSTQVDVLADDPMDLSDEDRSSTEFEYVANNTVTTQILNAFKDSVIGPGMSLILLGLVLLLGIGGLAIFMNNQFTELNERFDAQNGTRFESPGTGNNQIPGVLE